MLKLRDVQCHSCTPPPSPGTTVTPSEDDFGFVSPNNSKLVALRLPTTVEQLLFQYDSKSWFPVSEHMTNTQWQQDCGAARYLFIDDISTVSGMGWSILNMVSSSSKSADTVLLQSLQMLHPGIMDV